jgi:hypothetical protein
MEEDVIGTRETVVGIRSERCARCGRMALRAAAALAPTEPVAAARIWREPG